MPSLPRAMPGHRPFHLYPHDIAKAKQLIAAADPSDRKIDVWTNNFPTNLEAGEYYEGVLRELGFEPTLKAIDPGTYFTVTGNLSTPHLDTGLGNWLLEYPHPNNYFEPQLTGEAIQKTNNTNYSQFDDPELSAEVKRLRREPLGPSQEAAYARLEGQLGYRPRAPVTVVLYGEQEFRDVTRVHAGADGVFDGKIRLPIGATPPPGAALERLIVHEYAHAAIHDLSRGRAPRWLHEGLAQPLEGTTADAALRVSGPVTLAGLDSLLADPDPTHARAGYDVALSMWCLST